MLLGSVNLTLPQMSDRCESVCLSFERLSVTIELVIYSRKLLQIYEFQNHLFASSFYFFFSQLRLQRGVRALQVLADPRHHLQRHPRLLLPIPVNKIKLSVSMAVMCCLILLQTNEPSSLDRPHYLSKSPTHFRLCTSTLTHSLPPFHFRPHPITSTPISTPFTFLCSNSVLQQLFQIYLAWYYGSLTVREHILIANGSRMRTWWRVHHYLAICQTCILLMW